MEEEGLFRRNGDEEKLAGCVCVSRCMCTMMKKHIARGVCEVCMENLHRLVSGGSEISTHI